MNKNGLSLIELCIAMALASLVLIGVAGIAASMARSQIEGIRSGTVTGWSVASYLAMAKEIEDANVLAYPIADGASDDSILVCTNWSRKMTVSLPGARLDSTQVASVIQYCLDTSAGAGKGVMRRFSMTGLGAICPSPGVPAACTSAPPGPIAWDNTSVVGFRVEKLAGADVFTRDNSIGGVRLRYVVGEQAPAATSQHPVAKFTPFNFGIVMQKQFSSTVD